MKAPVAIRATPVARVTMKLPEMRAGAALVDVFTVLDPPAATVWFSAHKWTN
jgi:hypothetical protein